MNGSAQDFSDRIGQKLRQARQAQNLSLEQAASATFIRLRHLQAMEAGDFSTLFSQAQARGFLRAYASFLKLDPAPLLAALAGEAPTPAPEAESAPGEAPPSEPPSEAVTVPLGAPTAEAASPSTPPVPADAILVEIGQQLRQRRQLLGLSLEDVERHTRLRRFYLNALEEGFLERLPSPVQGRGMLHNYATFLGIDPEPLLLRFADVLQNRLAQRQAENRPQRTPSLAAPARKPVSKAVRFLSADFVFGSLLILAVIAFAIWGGLRILNLRSSGRPEPTAPSIAAVLLASETLPVEIEPATATPTLEGASGAIEESGEQTAVPTLSSENVQVYITVYQRAMLVVTVDGKEEFRARVLPNTAYTFVGKEKVEVLTGNGAALQVFFNGQDQGLMGLIGQVVYRIYTPNGVLQPTPTITLTPTPTQIPTATPEPTRTISPNLPEAPTLPVLP